MATIVRHTLIKHDVNKVDDFLNSKGLRLADVQITFTYNPRGNSGYMVFYEEDVDESTDDKKSHGETV